jgi:hypothetical protein
MYTARQKHFFLPTIAQRITLICIRHVDANPDSDPDPAVNVTMYEVKFLLVFQGRENNF